MPPFDEDKHQYVRDYSIDLLRLLSCISIVVLHTLGVPLSNSTIDSTQIEYQILLILSVIGHYGVPIFVMITGLLLLPPHKECGISKIYSKYIPHLMIAGISWISFYGIFHRLHYNIPFTLFPLGNQAYHLWYIPMIIVVYIFIPVLRLIANDKSVLYYSCLLWICHIMISFASLFLDFSTPKLGYLNYCGFLILAQCINTLELKKTHTMILYLLGIVGFLITCLITCHLGDTNNIMTGNFSPSIIVGAAACVVFARNFDYTNISSRIKTILTSFYEVSFGIYLIHPFVLLVCYTPISRIINNICFCSIIVSVIVFIASFFAVLILKKIPIIGRFCM